MSVMQLLISFDETETLLYGAPDPWLKLFECRYIDYDGDGNISFHEIIKFIVDQELGGDSTYVGDNPDIDIFGPDAASQEERDRYFAGDDAGEPQPVANDPTSNFDEPFVEDQPRFERTDPNASQELIQGDSIPAAFGDETTSGSRLPGEPGEEEVDRRRPEDEEEELVGRLRLAGVSEARIDEIVSRYRDPVQREQLLRNVIANRATSAAGQAQVPSGPATAVDPAAALLGAAASDAASPGTSPEDDTPQARAQELSSLNSRLDAAQQGGGSAEELRQIADGYEALAASYQGTGEVSARGMPLSGAISAYADQVREQARAADRQVGEAEYQRQFGEQSLSQLTEDLRDAQRGVAQAEARHGREGGNRSSSNLRSAERNTAREWSRLPPALREYREALEITLAPQFLGILEDEIKNNDVTPERAVELARQHQQASSSVRNQGDASYYPVVTYDARTNTFGREWVEDPSSDQDDGQGGGGGGGGGGREYTVADDNTISYTEDGRTYTVSDEDLAQDVRDAAATGDASRLSSVDRVTVSDAQGVPVAANFNAAPTDATGGPPRPVTDGSGNAGGTVGPPQVTQAIANAIAGDGMSSVNVGGVTVSRDSNGNVTVSDADLSVTYRSDGSVAGIRTSDGDAAATQAAEDAGLLVSQPDLVQAAAWSVNPETGWSTVNALAGDDWGALRAAQESWFNEQLANLPEDPAEKAARLARSWPRFPMS